VDFSRELRHFPNIANRQTENEYNWWDCPKRRLHYTYSEPRRSSIKYIKPPIPYEPESAFIHQRRHFPNNVNKNNEKDFEMMKRLKKVDTHLKNPSVIFDSISDQAQLSEELLLRKAMTRKRIVPEDWMRNGLNSSTDGDKPYQFVCYSEKFFENGSMDNLQKGWNISTRITKPSKRKLIEKQSSRKGANHNKKLGNANESRPTTSDSIGGELIMSTTDYSHSPQATHQTKMRSYKEVMKVQELLADVKLVEQLPDSVGAENDSDHMSPAPSSSSASAATAAKSKK
jgi:hypothetical protein